MKKQYKWISGALAGMLTICIVTESTCTVYAAADSASEKEEVVYIMMDGMGNPDSVNVVNIFGKGDITDYGNYSDVQMLTSTAPISQNGDEITFSSDQEKIYYQGTMENVNLPWNISIQYQLDGKNITPSALAGESGALEIHFEITENPACTTDFYDSYALQAAFTLNTAQCQNIIAEGATLANAGSDKQISYTVLPGKGLDAVITADVTDFEMSAVSINGIKLDLNVEIDDDELLEKVTEIMDAAATLNDGASELNDGSSELADGSQSLTEGADALYAGADSLDEGIDSLYTGVTAMQEGLNTLNLKSASLTNGSAQIRTALETIQTSLSAVSVSAEQLKTLTDSSTAIKQAINDVYTGALDLQNNISYAAYKDAMLKKGLNIDTLVAGNTSALQTLSAQTEQLKNSVAALKSNPAYAASTDLQTQAASLEAQIESFENILSLLTGNNAAIAGSEAYLGTLSSGAGSLTTGLDSLKTSYEAFDNAIAALVEQLTSLTVNMSSLKSGIDTLVTNYSTLDSGITEYTQGVATIAAAYSQLVNGVNALATGSKELLNGTGSLQSGTLELYDGVIALCDGTTELSDGTSEFYDKTSNMDSQVEEQIDDMIASISGEETETVSFVSSKNTNVKSVQFVMKTTAIEKEVIETVETEDDPKLNFWQKLLNLFGL